LRGQALYLPPRQSWRLVDHDPQLLDAARVSLIAWADRIESQEPLTLAKADRQLEIAFLRSDLSRFDQNLLVQGLDLVTAAAFFDLVSATWIEEFCAALAERRLPLYAVLSYVVAQRTTEIGLRIALGARQSDVLGWILRRGIRMAAVGTGIGLALSAMLTRYMGNLLFGVKPLDALTLAGASMALLVVSAISSSAPALRASRLDPMRALKEQ